MSGRRHSYLVVNSSMVSLWCGFACALSTHTRWGDCSACAGTHPTRKHTWSSWARWWRNASSAHGSRARRCSPPGPTCNPSTGTRSAHPLLSNTRRVKASPARRSSRPTTVISRRLLARLAVRRARGRSRAGTGWWGLSCGVWAAARGGLGRFAQCRCCGVRVARSWCHPDRVRSLLRAETRGQSYRRGSRPCCLVVSSIGVDLLLYADMLGVGTFLFAEIERLW